VALQKCELFILIESTEHYFYLSIQHLSEKSCWWWEITK